MLSMNHIYCPDRPGVFVKPREVGWGKHHGDGEVARKLLENRNQAIILKIAKAIKPFLVSKCTEEVIQNYPM